MQEERQLMVLSNAFNVPSIAVDTHVFRVANRLALADSDDVLEVENNCKKSFLKGVEPYTSFTYLPR